MPNVECLLADEDVLELPWVGGVDVLREEARAVAERCPVRVEADKRSQIGRLHLEAAAEVDVVSLDDASIRILQGPDHAGEHRGSEPEAGGF